MRPIATDTNDFPKLRGNGCIYVDKTENDNIFLAKYNRRNKQ